MIELFQYEFNSYWVGRGDLLLKVFLFKIYLYFICINVLLMCMSGTPCAGRGQKRMSDPGSGVRDIVKPLYGALHC